jgi:hypothetical protein
MSPNTTAQRVTHCRVCGAADWQEVVSLGDTPLAGGFLEPAARYDDEPFFPLGLISCRSCRLLSLTHVVDPEVLFRVYAYTTSESQTMRTHMSRVVELSRDRFAIAPDSLIVEIGSNVGDQLIAYQRAGMRTLGVDPARNIAEIANAAGVETLTEFFDAAVARRIRVEYGPAKQILGRHVFAHIDNIAEVLAGVGELLDADGVFTIEVPYALEMLRRNEFDTIYHEHLSYFFISTLVTLFARHGLRLVDVERVAVHGGSVLVSAARADSTWTPRPIVAELCALEERTGIDGDEVYRTFAHTIAGTVRELPQLLRRLTAGGKRIAGYGAPAKGNTLLNVCGMGEDLIEYCCDTTPFKQGKVQPGTHIPIRSPEYAKANPPDYFLLLAWNYADEIIQQESDFLACGGRFIVPIPSPTIVSDASRPGQTTEVA